ncbi:MAG: mechanosensitive ion channel family protein [Planctomycetota bacterium]|jgi:small conductance mechanosensitive channel
MSRPIPALSLSIAFSIGALLPLEPLSAQQTPPPEQAVAEQTQAQEPEAKPELTDEEKAAREAQNVQITLQGLQEEAKTSLEQLQASLAALAGAGKELAEAPEGSRAIMQHKVDALQEDVESQAWHLLAIAVGLEELGADTGTERAQLFEVLGDAGKKAPASKSSDELKAEAESMEPTELRKRIAIEYSLYKASLDRLDAADDAVTAAADADKPAAQKKLDAARAESKAMVANLRMNVDVLQARGDEGADLVTIESFLLQQEGVGIESVGDTSAWLALLSDWSVAAWDWIVLNGPGFLFLVVKFILIFYAFKILARILSRLTRKALSSQKLNLSELLKNFAIKAVRNVTLFIGLLVAISSVGVDMAPLLAMIAAAGLVVGLALQGTLSNFASGLMLLIYRPFDVKDVVVLDGVTGKVEDMTLVSTTILTLDNKLVVFPNNSIWGNTITNVTAKDERRVDLVFGIGYSDDIPKAEKILQEVVSAHPKVLETPETNIKLANLGESSVDFIVRPWSKTDDYWDVYWDLTREVKLRFDKEGISIPFPQRDVHLIPVGSEGEESASKEPTVLIPAKPPKAKGPAGITADAEAESGVGEAEANP